MKKTIFFINLTVMIITVLIIAFIYVGSTSMVGNIDIATQEIELNLSSLIKSTLRTSIRIIIALLCSTIMAIIYAILAAKNKYIGALLIPLLDIFQSVPVLGYLSFAVVGFLNLIPGNILGIELAIIFAIFSAQVWNMIFSVYQSLITIPKDLYEVSKIYHLNKWQIFWQVELPFAIPGLIWNMILSMSSSWFFIVASEAITVGNHRFNLPGLGTYIALALKEAHINLVLLGLAAILLVIFIFNQIIFAPLVSWSHKFKYEFNANTNKINSWFYDFLVSTTIFNFTKNFFHRISRVLLQLEFPSFIINRSKIITIGLETIWWIFIIVIFCSAANQVLELFSKHLSFSEITYVIKLGIITTIRVMMVLIIACLIWVPLGIIISQNIKLSKKMQPLLQFLTAIPANIYFPIFVGVIIYFKLNPEIWLSFMMIMGSQWYILYNILAGGQSIPTELIEATKNLKLSGFVKWKKLFIPSILPYLVTGLITASGGAWNASIVSEIISWGKDTITATGIGSYITINTMAGDLPKVAIGVLVMSSYVILMNFILWHPLSNYVSKKFRLD